MTDALDAAQKAAVALSFRRVNVGSTQAVAKEDGCPRLPTTTDEPQGGQFSAVVRGSIFGRR
jgi:hypothetical protein